MTRRVGIWTENAYRDYVCAIRAYAVGERGYPDLPCVVAPDIGADCEILWARLALASMYAHRLRGCKQYATFTDKDPWEYEGG